MDFAEIRANNPQYGDMTDSALADALHKKFYSDVPREQFDKKIGIAPKSSQIVKRGSILPLGRTAGGDIVPALPEFIEGPRQTIMDLLEGKRTAQEITGKEIFDLGALFAGGSAAGGTGKAITRAAAEREAMPVAERAATEAVPAAAEAVTPAARSAIEGASGLSIVPIQSEGRVLNAASADTFSYGIMREGQQVAQANFVREGPDSVFLSWIGGEGVNPNDLGPAAIRDVLRQFMKDHPEIKEISALRQNPETLEFGLRKIPVGEQTAPRKLLEGFLADQAAEAEVRGYRGAQRPIAAAVPDAPASPAAPPSAPSAELIAPRAAEAAPSRDVRVMGVPVGGQSALQTKGEFQTAATSFYKKMEDAKVIIKPDSFKALADDAIETAVKRGLDRSLTPDSAAVVRRLKSESGKPITFERLDILRQLAGEAQGAVKPSDRRIAGLIVDKIDDYIAAIGAKDVSAGNARQAAESILQARDLWSKAAKLGTIERLVSRAKDAAATTPFERALQDQFRAFAKNEAQMRKFTKDEQRAIRLASRGGLGEKTARGFGRFAPNSGPVGFFTSGGAGAAIGTLLGIGPLAGAMGGFAAGYSGRAIATALMKRNIGDLEELIKVGGNSRMASAAIRRGRSVVEQLATDVKLGASAQSAEDARKRR